MTVEREIARLPATTRTVFGKKLRALRRRGTIPVRISQKRGAEIFAEVDEKRFDAVRNKVGSFGLIIITLGDRTLPVMLERVQRDPISAHVLHVDLLAVDLSDSILAEVSVALVGESPAERSGTAFVVRQTDTVTLRGLPQALPRVLEGQLSSLTKVGDRILARDLSLPSGTELESDPDAVLAALTWHGVATEVAASEAKEPISTEPSDH